ncbi:MAG: 4-alpha-glucanotransferase [Prevotellaceae bacterium]|jgi:4-alpha-glucanotransferase|nr:4-alpha-glucanotransferase [Prevotellaceae bacterium]
MKIIFQVEYAARWGEELVVKSNLRSGDQPMACADGIRWTLQVAQQRLPEALRYRYALRKATGELEEEGGGWRTLAPQAAAFPTVVLSDSWRASGGDALISSPYTSVFFRRSEKLRDGGEAFCHHSRRLTIRASCIPQGCLLCVTGSDEALGGWDAHRPLLMQPALHGAWQTGFTPENRCQPIFYKYAIYDVKQQKVVRYEQRQRDRVLPPVEHSNAALWRNDEVPDFGLSAPRGAGVAIPVFALRSAGSYGVGQFSDLKLLADWAKQAGLSMIQVLPVNDTSATLTWRDSYPYSGISVLALHPLYLDLAPLSGCFTPKQAEQLKAEQRRLNALQEVDYERVMQLKWKYVRLAYGKEKTAVFASEEYKNFFAQRKRWLQPYAAFCYLRGRYKTADFAAWEEFAAFSEAKIAALNSPDFPEYDDVAIHCYVQLLLHNQLKEAATYCRSQGVILKGDIPIGVSRSSCDAWVAPELYNMDVQAGAPPDAFSATGQNWGFPTYCWSRMALDGYRWWQQRLHAMSEYFDAFRIDHILGFFRIWEIPLHSVQGLLGYFSPALPLSVSELNRRGAWFNAERLCTPYIREHVLQELFGDEACAVAQFFMEEYKAHSFRFKPEFGTQRKIEDFFAKQNGDSSELKSKLLDLLSDVVLIEDKSQPSRYHPRIAMHYARSYRELDEQQKQALDAIYLDFFYQRHNLFWKEQALQKLPAVRYATSMLACGEDLGMVPSCVPEVMQQLGLLSLIIQRMPNDSSVEFAPLACAPYLSVCSPGSHDTSGLREWWEEDRSATQRFYNHVLRHDGEAPATCEPWVVREIVLQHLNAPSMWAVFPLQDLLATSGSLRRSNPRAERINLPSNPHHYWRYRMHLTLEELLRRGEFSRELRKMVEDSGRTISS